MVWRESARQMDGAVSPMRSIDELRKRIDHELTAAWELQVALLDDRIVGMLAIKPSEAILDQIFVLPSEQAKGVGKFLLDAAKAAMPKGFTLRMALANRRAAGFYHHSGLILIGNGTHPISGAPVQYFRWEGCR